MWWYAIYQVSSSVQSRTASRVKSRSEGTWAFCSDQQWCGWIGGDHEVNGVTSFWELFCLSKMEGRPPQMRAISRVLVLGSTILSFQREQRIHVLPARWFEVEWIFSAADSGITDCYCIFHIIVIGFVKESKTLRLLTLRHLIRVMRKHDLTNKKTATKTNIKPKN